MGKEKLNPVARDKAYQMLNVAYMLRPMEQIASTMKSKQVMELTKTIKGKDVYMVFDRRDVAGVKKILLALRDDLIEMGVPEAAYPAWNYYENGNEEKLTKEETKTVKRLLE